MKQPNPVGDLLLKMVTNFRAMEPKQREAILGGAWIRVKKVANAALIERTFAADAGDFKDAKDLIEKTLALGLLSLYFKYHGDWDAMLEKAKIFTEDDV